MTLPRLSTLCLNLLMSMWLLALPATALAGVRCDALYAGDTLQTLSLDPDGDPLLTLRKPRQFCVGTDGARRSGARYGLDTADGRRLIPREYNEIIVLNATLSLVERRNLEDDADADNGWYLFRHRDGEIRKLPWDRFAVLQPRSMAPLPGVVIAVGDQRAVKGPGARDVGVITSMMKDVLALPDLQGHGIEHQIEYFATLRGERRAVMAYRNHAFVVHRAGGSQLYNLDGEPMTPLMADIQLLNNGLDAVTPLMQARHRDLPRRASAPLVPGQTEDTVYLPLDADGSLMALPDGAAGVMWFPSLSSRDRNVYIAGWAIVFPGQVQGQPSVELAVGTGSVVQVVQRAAALPRYAGMSLANEPSTADRVMLKRLDVPEWISLDSATLRVDERTQRASQPGILWAQANKAVMDRFLAARQKALDRIAELEALREAERARLAAAAARHQADIERLNEQARHGTCGQMPRHALSRIDRAAAGSYLDRCGIVSADEVSLASSAGVAADKVAAARSTLMRRNAEQDAQRARNAGMAALANAMKYRGPDPMWADVRVYDRNGMYQGTRTMTRNQADTLGAR